MLFFVAPLRATAKRFSLSIFLILSTLCIILGKTDVRMVEDLRAATADFMAPILAILREPVHAVTGGVEGLRDSFMLHRQNILLRTENAELLQWQAVARRLQTENTALRELLRYQPQSATWFITARIIGTAGGAFSRNLLIDRGAEQGIARGQAAFTGTGLVGRISEVGRRASRVLMLTDINSRIPVTIGNARVRAILAGDNSDQPLIYYLPSHMTVQVGDRVVTSGDGGVMPPDVPVGVISAVDETQIRVQPTSDLSRADYLRIADFGLSGVLPADKVPQPANPVKKTKGAAGDAKKTGTAAPLSPAGPAATAKQS